MIFMEAFVFSFWLIQIVNITVWGKNRLRKVNLGTALDRLFFCISITVL